MFRIFLFSILFISALGSRASKPDSLRILNHNLGAEIGVHHNYLFGQTNKDTVRTTKHRVSINLGAHINWQFGGRYSPPHYILGHSTNSNPSGGWTSESAWSKHVALSYSYYITDFLFVQSGLGFFNRKYVAFSDPDSAIKYVQNMGQPNPPVFIKHSSGNFELPVYLGFSSKIFSVAAGLKFTMYNKTKFYEILLDGTERKRFSNFSKFGGGGIGNFMYPSMKIQCRLFNYKKKMPITMYVAADMRNSKTYDFQAGCEVYIFNK